MICKKKKHRMVVEGSKEKIECWVWTKFALEIGRI